MKASKFFSFLQPLSPFSMQGTWRMRWRGGVSLRNLFASVPSLHLGHLSPHPQHPHPSDTRVSNPTQLPLPFQENELNITFLSDAILCETRQRKLAVSLCSTLPCGLSVELQLFVSCVGSVSRSYNYLRDLWWEEEKLMSAVYSL